MLGLSGDQVAGIVRAFIPVAVVVASHFGIGEVQVTMVLGGLSALLVAIWSAFSNTQQAQINSVNKTDNGVMVVADTANVVQVNTPLKGN